MTPWDYLAGCLLVLVCLWIVGAFIWGSHDD